MTSEPNQPSFEIVPEHIAIIMDGNGRWAKARGLPRLAGHRAGTENLRTIIRAAVKFGVKYLTFYAFSTENWARPDSEVSGLMKILSDVIERELDELHAEGARLVHIGDLNALPDNLQKKIRYALELTKDNTRITIVLALNYGGRDEILQAVKRMIRDQVDPEKVDEALMSEYLYTAGIPDPDLLIRTSGEQRISNFLTWQSVYSELYFPETYWPDFGEEELRKAIEIFGKRDRRYGGLKEN
jgi:undecaprenyl diphosphate synthase